MKAVSLIVLFSASLSVPAAASVVHQTSLLHDGGTISVSYEPRTKTNLRQTGLGPRSQAACIWTAEISVERKLIDGSGRPIEAMTRIVGEPKVTQGLQPGYCAHIEPRDVAMFRGDTGKMQAFLTRAAENDRPHLHAELASLGSLGRGASR
jgi:hypothetical protein